MNRKLIITSTIILGLLVISCTHNQRNGKPNTIAKTETGKDSSATKQNMNTDAQIYAKQQVPVLCYHRISDGNKGDYTVSPATFSAHMKVLSDSGYHSISPAQLYDYLV